MSEFDNLRNDAEQFAEKEGEQQLKDRFDITAQSGNP